MTDPRPKEERLLAALKFCRDMAEEEWEHQQSNPGAECALRHIARRCRDALEKPELPVADQHLTADQRFKAFEATLMRVCSCYEAWERHHGLWETERLLKAKQEAFAAAQPVQPATESAEWVREAKLTLDRLAVFLQSKGVPYKEDWRDWIDNAQYLMPAVAGSSSPPPIAVTSPMIDKLQAYFFDTHNLKYSRESLRKLLGEVLDTPSVETNDGPRQSLLTADAFDLGGYLNAPPKISPPPNADFESGLRLLLRRAAESSGGVTAEILVSDLRALWRDQMPAIATSSSPTATRPPMKDGHYCAVDAAETVGMMDIVVERARQIHSERWTRKHDDEHDAGVLSAAGAAYASNAADNLHPYSQGDGQNKQPAIWPFDAEWWKPKDPRCDLVRAAALIVAEIDRIDRFHYAELQKIADETEGSKP